MRCAHFGPVCLAATLALGSTSATAVSDVQEKVPPTAPAAKPAQPPAPGRARQTPPAGPRVTLTVMVTALDGKTLPGVVVTASGPVDREASTDSSGLVNFLNMSPGTYRLRFEQEGFITFEKEVSLTAGKPLRASASLSAAPPPPPPPTPAPAALAPKASPGPAGSYTPNWVDIPDLFEKEFIGNNPVKRSSIGCTLSSTSTLVQLREPIAEHAHADADELIYVVAGEGTHRVGGKEHALSGGVFSTVPRGVTHGIVRKGRQPLVIISTLSGPACQPGQ